MPKLLRYLVLAVRPRPGAPGYPKPAGGTPDFYFPVATRMTRF